MTIEDIFLVCVCLMCYFGGELTRAVFKDYYCKSNSGLLKWLGQDFVQTEKHKPLKFLLIAWLAAVSPAYIPLLLRLEKDEPDSKRWIYLIVIIGWLVLFGCINLFGFGAVGWWIGLAYGAYFFGVIRHQFFRLLCY